MSLFVGGSGDQSQSRVRMDGGMHSPVTESTVRAETPTLRDVMGNDAICTDETSRPITQPSSRSPSPVPPPPLPQRMMQSPPPHASGTQMPPPPLSYWPHGQPYSMMIPAMPPVPPIVKAMLFARQFGIDLTNIELSLNMALVCQTPVPGRPSHRITCTIHYETGTPHFLLLYIGVMPYVAGPSGTPLYAPIYNDGSGVIRFDRAHTNDIWTNPMGQHHVPHTWNAGDVVPQHILNAFPIIPQPLTPADMQRIYLRPLIGNERPRPGVWYPDDKVHQGMHPHQLWW